MENSWIESYLDALLSQGLSTEHLGQGATDDDVFNADKNVTAKYYLQQILEMDEVGLWQAWSRVHAVRHADEKDARLEFLCWRVWFLKQRNYRVSAEEGARLREEVPDETTLSVSSEDESDEELLTPTTELDFMRQVSENLPSDAGETFLTRVDKLYVILISLHGLIRGEAMELGRDADTGGQVKYVVELARELGRHPAVHRVDLLTRQICNPSLHEAYSLPEECLQKGEGKFGGSYIARLPCGPSDAYIRKEELWPHIREFADRGLMHAKKMLNLLGEAGEPCELYYIHGHYADAGEVAALMAQTLGVDMVLTGHSLGRNKLEHLLASGKQSLAEIEKTYCIGRRIEAEERALDEAIMVFTSTRQEVHAQWGMYHGYNGPILHTIRRRKKSSHHMPLMRVVPPGLDFHSLRPEQKTGEGGEEMEGFADWAASPVHERPEPPIWKEVFKFLTNPRKPVILAMSRPDAKKNITTLVRAYGQNETLRELANLVLIMGNRDVIDSLPKGSKSVLLDVLKLIDAYDLYGMVAYPKHHRQDQVKDIYALAERTRGIFINPALQEPFGLTLIEAAAYGAPIVATRNGGPIDIVATLKNGLLIDPLSEKEIGDALVRILTEKNLWEDFSRNGLTNIGAYSWTAHCEKVLVFLEQEKKYIQSIKYITPLGSSWDDRYYKETLNDVLAEDLNGKSPVDLMPLDDHSMKFDPESRLAEEERDSGMPRVALRKRLVIAALDNTPSARQALKLLKSIIVTAYGRRSEHRRDSQVGFGIASMLSYDATCSIMDQMKLKVADVDFVVCNSGADLFVWQGGDEMTTYQPYDIHIEERWNKVVIERVLERVWADQQKKKQMLTKSKIDSGHFHVVKEVARQPVEKLDDVTVVDRVHAQLRSAGIRVSCILQVDKTQKGSKVSPLLHITPIRASRSLAIRFLVQRLGISMENVVMLCIASSITQSAEANTMSVGFVTSDADALVGGTQRVIIVPPTAETKVRVPQDKVDEKMIQKLSVECGPNVFKERVVLLDGPKTKIDEEIADLLPNFEATGADAP